MSPARTRKPSAPLRLAAIADDLTGGVEMASMLVSRGFRTAFAIGCNGPHDCDCDAQVIALRTRTIERRSAVRQTIRALDRLLGRDPRQVFFKYCATFDSTFRGNIGPCAEAMLARLGEDFTVFCPTYPEAGRTVYQGHLFVGGQLLSESPKRLDPVTPMTDSSLLRVLAAQSRSGVGLIPFTAVRAGVNAVERCVEELRRAGVRLAVADAIDNDDVATLAEACRGLRLVTGNSGMAAYLIGRPQRGRRGGSAAVGVLPPVEGRAVVLAGSCAERTADQLDAFGRQRPVLKLDMDALCAERDVVSPAFAWAAKRVGEGPVAIATTMGPADVAALQSRHGIERTARAAETALAAIARRLVTEAGVRRVLIAGGETSGAILAALGIDALDVGPFELPGLSRAVSRGESPLALVLKSGKLGPVDMFLPALEALRQPLGGAPRRAGASMRSR